jgi:hypothetical protein
MYNILSLEIGLSSATLATFYRHQRSLLKTSLDKIETWLEKVNKKIDNSVIVSSSSGSGNRNNFLSNSNIILDDNNDNNLVSNTE